MLTATTSDRSKESAAAFCPSSVYVAMWKFLAVLSCLMTRGHPRRTQISFQRVQSNPLAEGQSPLQSSSGSLHDRGKSSPRNSLLTLLQKDTAAAAFVNGGPGVRLPLRGPSDLRMFFFERPIAKKDSEYPGKMRKGRVSPMREVPAHIPRPDYAEDGEPKEQGDKGPDGIKAKSADDIAGMRVAGRIAREVLDAAGRSVAVGVTTDEIDAIVHKETIARNSYPSPLNYFNFPKSCCTSVNEVIAHGIPDSYELQDGDIVNIDVTIYHDGFHGDCSETFLVGNVDEKHKKLVKVTHDAWQAAIKYCKPGKPYRGIGKVIQDYVEAYGYTTCPQFVGHGIGRVFHQDPEILHVRNYNPWGKMRVGHTFTIEPMVCEGEAEHIEWEDGWTTLTKDGKRSAQFEHTLLITPDGVEELTGRLPDSNEFWWE